MISPPTPVKVKPVVPATSRSSLIVTAESVSEIAPDREKVVAPEIAPAVVIFKALEVRAKVPVAFPRAVFPVDEVLRFNVGAVIAAVPEESVKVNPVNPVEAIAPEVEVSVKAPVVWVKPLEAVNVPAEVIVPVPVVEILPEVVTLSPLVVGERVVPVLDQYPMAPEVGAVEVRFLEASV